METTFKQKTELMFCDQAKPRLKRKWNSQSKRARSSQRLASSYIPSLFEAEGNVYFLVGIARRLARQLNMNEELIVAEMRSGDEKTILEVFDKYFTGLVSEHSFPTNNKTMPARG